MNVEIVTEVLIQHLLRKLAPLGEGAFIEVGLGSVYHSFTWAGEMGFACFGIEPLVTDRLRAAVTVYKVDLTEAVISSVNGTIPIHVGSLNGFSVSDVSSIRPDWWGSGHATQDVPSIRFPDYLIFKGITKIACLKVDTEGSEFAVISTLMELEPARLPRLVMFEYGGGGTRLSATGGWKPNFFNDTLGCVRVMQRLGYSFALVVEESAKGVEIVELHSLSDAESLFADIASVGNIVCILDSVDRLQITRTLNVIVPRVMLHGMKARWHQVGVVFSHSVKRLHAGIMRRLVSHGK